MLNKKSLAFILISAMALSLSVKFTYIKNTPKTITILYWDDKLFDLCDTDDHTPLNVYKTYCFFRDIMKSSYGYHTIVKPIEPFDEKYFKQSDRIFYPFYVNVPAQKFLTLHKYKSKIFAHLAESPISRGHVQTARLFSKKIFTYDSSEQNGQNIFQVMIPYAFRESFEQIDYKNKDILIKQIASANDFTIAYFHRWSAVRYFVENHPEDFQFYGKNWEKIKPFLSSDSEQSFQKQYGGVVDDKIKTLQNAKFVLALENYRHNGYISEKIFDAMQADAVPIYWGAKDIKNYIPSQCYIDFDDFKSFEKLYNFIKNMSPQEYEKYRNCIHNFIDNFKTTPFYNKTVIRQLINHMEDNSIYSLIDGKNYNLFIPQYANFQKYCLLENPTKCGKLKKIDSNKIEIFWDDKTQTSYTKDKLNNYIKD